MTITSANSIGDSNDQHDLNSAFGMGSEEHQGGETNLVQQEPEVKEEKQEVSVPSSEEPQKEPEGTSPDVSEERRMVIDTIEAQLDKFEQGSLTADDLREYFEKHTDIAQIANKSKRVKERYRSFIEGKHPKLQNPEEPIVAKQDNEESADKPLTLKDIERLLNERDAANISRGLRREREETLVSFAQTHGVVDEEVEAVQKTADALLTVHEEWSYQESLSAALRAVRGESKTKPVPEVGSSVGEPTVKEEEPIDLSKQAFTFDASTFGLSQ